MSKDKFGDIASFKNFGVQYRHWSLKDRVIWLLKSFNVLILESKLKGDTNKRFNIEKEWGLEGSEPFSLVDRSFVVSVVPLQNRSNLFLLVGDTLQLVNKVKPNLGVGSLIFGSRFYGVLIDQKELSVLVDVKVEGLRVWFTNYEHLYVIPSKNKVMSKIDFALESIDDSGKLHKERVFWHNQICKYDSSGLESYRLKGVVDDSRD